MKKHLFKIFLLLWIPMAAQSNMEEVMGEIRRNNKTIQSNVRYAEAQKLQYRTGISLYDPTVEYDYLKGSPADAGNQTDVTVTQSFDFPTSYFRRRQLARLQALQEDYRLKAANREILFEARQVCIELVYRNKLKGPLELRKTATEKWLSQFRKRLKQGDGNILDVNKAELQLIDIKKNHQTNLAEIARLHQRLTALNGGEPLIFSDTVYFEMPSIPDFETLEKEIEQNDPALKVLQQEKAIAEKQVEVTKSMAYPKMELGYHYQGILGQTYNGVHSGMTIPLWESRNTVKLQKARSAVAESQIMEHSTEHYHEIKQLYLRYENLKAILADYSNTMNARENIRLLDKAFALGHLSSLEYFAEVSYYNNVFNDYLATERELHEVVASLYKFRLE